VDLRERHGGLTGQQAFAEAYARPAGSPFWARPPANLGGPEFLFTDPAYDRGAMTLQALRAKVGDAAFFTILRQWATRHRHGNVTTGGFIRLAEKVSGRQLDSFFDVWLFRPGKPRSW
jgi:aminopeptidase N